MNTTNSLSNTSLLYNRGGYSIKNDSVAISANRFQMLKSALIKLMLAVAIVAGGKVAWGQTTGTISFGNNGTKINSTNVSGNDNLENTWTITTVMAQTSFTQSTNYSQVGSSNKPATSITFTTTLPSSVNITSMSAKFGGFNGTAGTITLKVESTTIGSGSLSGNSDVTVNSNSSATGNVLTVTVTDISKGVKVYYIEYTYTAGNSHTLFSAVDPVGAGTVVLSSTTIEEGSTATATASPNAGYAFDHWSISGTGASLSSTSENPTTVTMGTSNATVTAHFTEIPKYEITFNNGTGTLSTLTEEYGGAGIVLPSETAPYCNSPSYIFYGWAEEEVSNPSIVPTIVGMAGNRYFPSRNTTLYAVYATVSEYSKVTSSPDYEDKTGIYLIVCENDGVAFDGRKDPLDVSSNNVGVTISNNTIASNNTIDSISFYFFNIENNYTIRSSSGKFIGRDSDSNGLDSDASTEYSNAISFSSGNANIVSGGAYLRYNYTSGQNRFRYYKSTTYTGQRAIQLYKAVATYTSEPLCASATVIYDANGATTGTAPIDPNSPYTLVNGQKNIELLYNTGNLAKTGYTFDGWNTEFDGSGISYSEGTTFTLTDNIVLYAKWNPNVYSITWYSNGAAIESLPIYHGNSLLDEGNDIADLDGDADVNACDGMHFVGWYESEFEEFDGTPTLLQSDDIARAIATDNKNYYAVFANVSETAVRWNLVTDEDNLAAGDSVIIVASGYTYAMSKTQNDNNRGQTDITKSGSEITLPLGSNVCIFELRAGNTNGTWAFYDAAYNNGDGGFLYAASSSKNYLRTEEELDNNGVWTISIDEGTGVATITAQGSNSHNLLRYNNSNSIFSCYANGQQGVSIYKKTGGTSYSAYTTFCPCNYGIDNISNGDMVWAGKNANADWNSTINWTRYNEGGYHLTANAPTSSNNVYIIEKAECEIDALPHINENTTCNNLTMLNGLGIDIAENKTLTINGTATFTNGVINGNVIFGSSATVSGASTSSHVDGIVTKSGAANGFTFPTGSNGNLGKVVVTDGSATNVSVQYFSNPAGFSTNDLPRWWNAADMSGENPFNHVSNVEYWKISSNEAITANFVAEASTDMHFNSETAEEDRIPANIQMAFYDNNRWTNVGGSASIDGNTLSINGAEIPASATRGISGNYTTFGSKSKSTVLPIELVSFTANCNGRSALIEWTTATEKNNDFFVLERSHDAVNFKEIARIAGAGNSIEPISYAYTDFGVRNGDNYYRLIQFDYDGTSTASEIIVANCLGTDGEPEVLAYPNPFGDDLTLRFENFGNIQATVEVYDMLGRMVHTQKINCSQNDYEVVLRLAGLSDGTYNVKISAKEFVLNKKVVKQ